MARAPDADRELDRLTSHIAALEAERDRLKARDHRYQIIFDQTAEQLAGARPQLERVARDFDGISFVIAYYNIPRQIERTLLSCSPAYQGVGDDEIEVILIDNGSSEPLPADITERHPHVSKIIRVDGNPSPVVGLNQGIAEAQFGAIGLMIDGAHILSPGVVANVRDVVRLFDRPVINVPQYILGSISQNLTSDENAFETEAAALRELGWPRDGYRLFDYAVFPGENPERSFFSAIESNCLIATKETFDTCGGFDLRFDEPGAGFANLELFSRLIHDLRNAYVLLPGEGSFHQDHQGVTTNKSPEERDEAVRRYKIGYREVTGGETVVNARSPFLFGCTRRSTQRIPTISREFGSARSRILKQLANIFVARARGAITDEYKPQLAIGGSPDERLARTPIKPLGLLSEAAQRNECPEKALSYVACLKTVHERIDPDLYLEIGVDTGASLRLARCDSIGIDPGYFIANPVAGSCRLFRETSDAFFANQERCAALLSRGVDFAFIDGMHLAESVLRDFINVEKWMNPDGVIVFDDVLPERLELLDRERRFNAWCGDVYRIVPFLRRHRPDLDIKVVEAFVGPYRKGLAVVRGLDPESRVLEERLPEMERDLLSDAYAVQSIPALEDLVEIGPLSALRDMPLRSRRAGHAPAGGDGQASSISLSSGGAPTDVKVSIVVIAYDMARELPRTLRSLSPQMQNGVAPDDYEVIVVDNGSPEPLDIDIEAFGFAHSKLIRMPPGCPSPCYAANTGIEAAAAPTIGVMIDGARIASPGIVRAALDGLKISEKAVVGAHGFHLGPALQQVSTIDGYDQAEEDRLLRSINWEEDGYRLFDISVPSKSSGKGWLILPSETNALFMHREQWTRLGGYDEQFESPGGGLANLDIWRRACEADGATPIMMLGEGTFHQVHGGVTTNAASSPRAAFDKEYEHIRGAPYQRPDRQVVFIGRLHPAALRKLAVETPRS